MSCPLLHKSNATAGKTPAASSLVLREITINTGDGLMHTKLNDGTVAVLNPKLARFAKRLVTNSSGQVVVTFPTGTFTTPIVTALVNTPTADAGTYTYKTEILGTPTATGCTIKVTRQLNSVTILALGTITLAQAAPANISVDVHAFEAN